MEKNSSQARGILDVQNIAAAVYCLTEVNLSHFTYSHGAAAYLSNLSATAPFYLDEKYMTPKKIYLSILLLRSRCLQVKRSVGFFILIRAPTLLEEQLRNETSTVTIHVRSFALTCLFLISKSLEMRFRVSPLQAKSMSSAGDDCLVVSSADAVLTSVHRVIFSMATQIPIDRQTLLLNHLLKVPYRHHS